MKRNRKNILGRLKTLDCKLQAIVDTCSEPVSLFTVFNASSATGNACVTPDLSPYDLVLYHDGEGEYPVEGDTVYTDPEGTTPFNTEINQDVQMDNGEYLACAENGTVETITCK